MNVDITERRNAEQTLRESEHRLKILFEAAPDAYYIHDLEGRFVDGNKVAEELVGYRKEETIGKTLFELKMIIDADVPKVMAAIAENKQGKPAGPLELTVHRKDGHKVIVETRSYPVEIDGQTLVLGIARDITERKRSREALQESEAKYRSVIENANIGVIVIQDGKRVFYNSKIHEMLGYTDQEYREIDFASVIHPEDRALTFERIRQRLEGVALELDSTEIRLVSKSGETKWIEASSAVIQWEGRPALQAFIYDITQRKEAEKRLQQYQKKLKSLTSELALAEERERRRIAVGIHDDMAQKLAMTKFELQSLGASIANESIAASLKGPCDLINEIVEDARGLVFELGNAALYQVGLEAAVESWLVQEIRDKHGLRYEFVADGSGFKLDDDTQITLFRAVKELVANVIKYADASTVHVSIRKSADTVHVGVEDNGAGFDVSRLDASFTPKGGFGLFNIRERLEYLGGSLTIDSGLGKGTRVIMAVPLRQEVRTGK